MCFSLLIRNLSRISAVHFYTTCSIFIVHVCSPLWNHFDFLGTFPHEQEKVYILVEMEWWNVYCVGQVFCADCIKCPAFLNKAVTLPCSFFDGHKFEKAHLLHLTTCCLQLSYLHDSEDGAYPGVSSFPFQILYHWDRFLLVFSTIICLLKILSLN